MKNNTTNGDVLKTLITIYVGLILSIILVTNYLSKQIQDINKPEIINTKTIDIKSDTSYVYYDSHIYTIRTRGDSISIVNMR